MISPVETSVSYIFITTLLSFFTTLNTRFENYVLIIKPHKHYCYAPNVTKNLRDANPFAW